MTNDRKIYKPRPVTGFPEWLPEIRLVEQKWFDRIRQVFESYGFCNIETPSVEELDVLRAKGEVDKEIYVIERLHKDDNDKSEARLALHFDQTVPLARYVAQNFNDLVFPFKRYRMQRVWRGERPQKGRFREFYQCDIDVIGIDNLPLHFDAEMPAVMWEILSGLPGMENEKIQIRLSNRKIWLGFLNAMQIKDSAEVLRIIDKFEKTGLQAAYLSLEAIIPQEDIQKKIIALAGIKSGCADDLAKKLFVFDDILDPVFREGCAELLTVMKELSHLPADALMADTSIVRGLDYYTGTVYETVFIDDPGYGSICSGGRYDDLAGGYINKHLPGVGISIGFSRLFARMVDQSKLPVSAKSPAHVLVVMPSDEKKNDIVTLCRTLRMRGLNVEMFHAAKKIPDQLKYASRKGIPYVWFPADDGRHEVKNMATGIQSLADPESWNPDGEE